MSSSSQPINLLYQALSLDCSVLEALLKKHRNSHGRTVYFRRMKMVLQAIQKWQTMSLESDFNLFKEKVQALQKKKNKRSRDEEWSIYADKSKEANPKEDLKQSWKEIIEMIDEGFTEVISRTLHASKALMTEIQRGFFLPFCTVALAALARISCLHKRIGNWAISELQNIETNLLQLPQDFMQKATKVFLESAPDEMKETYGHEALLASMGIAGKKSSTNHETIDTKSQDSENDDMAMISQPSKFDNDDVGESLVSSIAPSSKVTVDKGGKAKKQTSIIDQNAVMLERLKDGDTASQGKKKQTKKRKDPLPPERSREMDGKKKKKKKKKSKNKGKDFFDDLFD